MKETVQ